MRRGGAYNNGEIGLRNICAALMLRSIYTNLNILALLCAFVN